MTACAPSSGSRARRATRFTTAIKTAAWSDSATGAAAAAGESAAGGGPGARASFTRFLEDRLSIIVLINMDDVDVDTIVQGLAALYLRRHRHNPGVVPLDTHKKPGPSVASDLPAQGGIWITDE